MPGQSFGRERREAVLSRAVEVGEELAAREASVTVETLRRWRTRAEARAEVDGVEPVDGELVVPAAPVVSSDPVGEEDDGDLEAQLRRTAVAARRAAESAIRRLEEALPTARNVQAISISIGVLTDKAQMLERLLEEAEERKARLAQGQAEVIASLFPLALEAAGVPVGPFRPVLGELLRRAGGGEPLVVSPAVAQPAYAAVRGYFERIIRAELEDERKALPAGDLPEPDEHEHDPVENFASGVEARAEGEVVDGEEPVDAEVVDEQPRPAFDVEAVAAAVAAKIAEEERPEPWSALRTRTPPSSFSVDDPAASIVRYGPQRWSS